MTGDSGLRTEMCLMYRSVMFHSRTSTRTAMSKPANQHLHCRNWAKIAETTSPMNPSSQCTAQHCGIYGLGLADCSNIWIALDRSCTKSYANEGSHIATGNQSGFHTHSVWLSWATILWLPSNRVAFFSLGASIYIKHPLFKYPRGSGATFLMSIALEGLIGSTGNDD